MVRFLRSFLHKEPSRESADSSQGSILLCVAPVVNAERGGEEEEEEGGVVS